MKNALAAIFALALSFGSAQAAIIPVTSAAGINDSANGIGTHYHTNPGTTAGVNRYFGETGRGVMEFNIAGVGSVTNASLLFQVSGFSDIYTTNSPYQAPINVVAYQGDNLIQLSDFQAASFASIGNFATAGLSIGNALSFDVTAALQAALGLGYTSIGFRLEGTSTITGDQTIQFSNIRLSTDATPVPEPGTLALLGAALFATGALRRRRQDA